MRQLTLVLAIVVPMTIVIGCSSESSPPDGDDPRNESVSGNAGRVPKARDMLPAKSKEDLLTALRVAFEDGDVVAIQQMTKFPDDLTEQQKHLMTIGARVIDQNKLISLSEQTLDTVSGTPEQLREAGVDAVARLETEDADGDTYNVDFQLTEEDGSWFIQQDPKF